MAKTECLMKKTGQNRMLDAEKWPNRILDEKKWPKQNS